jgi:hypothetical protein
LAKGRRAADRRRQRQGGGSGEGGDDEPGDGKTSPSLGAFGASGGQAGPAARDGGPQGERSASASRRSVAPLASEPEGGDDELPLVSQIREVEPDPPTRTRKARGGARGDSQSDADPEESFVRAVRDASADARSGPGEITLDGGVPLAAPRCGARLLVLEGPDQGAKLDVGITPALLGRTRDADLKLADATVSLRHAELALLDDGWVLFDLGSHLGDPGERAALWRRAVLAARRRPRRGPKRAALCTRRAPPQGAARARARGGERGAAAL